MESGIQWLNRVRTIMEESEIARTVSEVKKDGGLAFTCGTSGLRALSLNEIAELQKNGNTSDDWSRIRVAASFNVQTVRHSSFYGDVTLGVCSKKVCVDGVDLPSGVHNCTLVDCVVGNNVLMRDVKLLSCYVIGSNSILLNCGSITCDRETTFGSGENLPVGLESGGRDVAVFAEIDVEIASRVAKSRKKMDDLLAYNDAVSNYTARIISTRGIIAEHSVVRDTPKICNSFVGPFAQIDGATLVENTTLLSNEEERSRVESGACVASSIIQWGGSAATMSLVDHSVLTEHSRVARHGKVTNSILGPNTSVAAGEATACLLGPFICCDHQSLLIAALWPEGKGNIGYGANVGSNHTSKAPDQEIWPGEGAFFGLGVNIKFPSDFSRAPYSIVASGVSALPQKVTFPFSLINSSSASYPNVSPAYNEIIPAWLLTDNMFTLKRNEGKYASRNKARRTKFVFDVFRPDTVDLMLDSCRRLESISEAKDIYTDRDIAGLGKNYMLENSRQTAIDAYRFYTKYYALLGLKDAVQKQNQSHEGLLTTSSDDPLWEHQRKILVEEFKVTDGVAALRELPNMLEKVANDIEISKSKDDKRGARIIDDYSEVHPPAADDKFVIQTWQETRELIGTIEKLISEMAP